MLAARSLRGGGGGVDFLTCVAHFGSSPFAMHPWGIVGRKVGYGEVVVGHVAV